MTRRSANFYPGVPYGRALSRIKDALGTLEKGYDPKLAEAVEKDLYGVVSKPSADRETERIATELLQQIPGAPAGLEADVASYGAGAEQSLGFDPLEFSLMIHATMAQRGITRCGDLLVLAEDTFLPYSVFDSSGSNTVCLPIRSYSSEDACAEADRLILDEDCFGFALLSQRLGSHFLEKGRFTYSTDVRERREPSLYTRENRTWHVF